MTASTGGSSLVRVTDELPTATITVAVTRLADGTGSGLCSTGIPLPPGTLNPSETAKVKVTISSVEQQIYVEALSGLHSDGTVRSILVQFNISCDYGYPLSGTVEVGVGVTRGTEDISKTAVTWTTPVIVCLPTDPDYLVSCGLILPTIPVADVPESPTEFGDYEDDFVTCGDVHWNADEISVYGIWNSNFYDRALIWFTWWIRTGAVEYFRRGLIEAGAYMGWASSTACSPRDSQQEGVELIYRLVGYDTAKTNLVTIANFLTTYYSAALDNTTSWADSRQQSRILLSKILCHRLGDTSKDWAALAAADLTTILTTQEVTGDYRMQAWDVIDPPPTYGHSPYMMGMLHDAFIKYYTWIDADSRIPPAIKLSLDWTWTNCWLSGDGSFMYVSDVCETGGLDPSPDLNQFNASIYSWYYWYSADSDYLTKAETIFANGVNLCSICGAQFKQFNENYRQSAHHFVWRLGQ